MVVRSERPPTTPHAKFTVSIYDQSDDVAAEKKGEGAERERKTPREREKKQCTVPVSHYPNSVDKAKRRRDRDDGTPPQVERTGPDKD